MQPTSVYIIECAGYCKIGVARNPEDRLRSINTGAPVRATLYRTREFPASLVARHVESHLHRLFRPHRSNGEWFDITPRKAWEALKRANPPTLANPKERADSLARWDFSDVPHDLTNLLTQQQPF